MDEEKKINKLLKEYELKLIQNDKDRRMLLIDFAREYNEVWK